jgi:protein arginine N-methyltransferase 5
MACFLQNKKGFPVLGQQHAEIIKTFMKIQCRIVIQPRHPNDCWDKHFKYLAHLFSKHDCLEPEDKVEVGYRNYLQSPLQPLADNLESSTYETFENDLIKYELYERACY